MPTPNWRAAHNLSLLLSLCSCGSPQGPTATAGAPPATAHQHHPATRDPGAARDREPNAVHVRFSNPEKWSKQFDSPRRRHWQRPEQVLTALQLNGDETVADLGAGTGYFSLRLAARLPRGRVLAVELEQPMLDWIARRARAQGLTNLTPIRGTQGDPKLPSGLDLVLLVNTYHHISQRLSYFRRLRNQLSPKGRLAIVDFRMGKLPIGPANPHKISQHQLQRELQHAGFKLCGRYDQLPYQYMLLFCPEGQHSEPRPIAP